MEINPASQPQIHPEGQCLKVVHLPVFSENPYQSLLMKSLAEQGLEVIEGGGGGNFLRTALFRWSADLYHFHWLHPYLLRKNRASSVMRATRFLLEVLLLRLSGARIVWTVHNLSNHERLFPTIERIYTTLFARLTDGIIVHSQGARSEATKVFKLSERKPLEVIPQGSFVDRYSNQTPKAECRAKLNLPEGDFVFLFLGRVEPYKGVLDLIRCFRKMPVSSRLLIAGRVSDAEFLRLLLEASSGAPNIRLDEGFVPDDELQTYFNAADAFVFPVRDILNSSSIALAMSFGLACIAPSLGGIKEMLGDDGGIVYDPVEPRGLLSAMESALQRCDELREIGRNNLRRAQQDTWAKAAVRTEAFYRSVIGDRNPQPIE